MSNSGIKQPIKKINQQEGTKPTHQTKNQQNSEKQRNSMAIAGTAEFTATDGQTAVNDSVRKPHQAPTTPTRQKRENGQNKPK